ncbi:hypothetical protein GQX74_010772 [Glossina fuscipes]|uniref:Uncharacterized protein n=1 Tax=Glossina palpalis gambiensis TaxID=67801 RepID=A0A1B0BYB6_9MUSC|nr:hypothetical protein GQX74_010772 [Glossina fuscipes]
MSRKRALLDAEISGSATDSYENYVYYRPGCYSIPQVVRRATPYTCTYLQPWYPYCTAATYVVDDYGRVYYLSDFEHQLQVPRPPLPLQTEIVYHYYKIDDNVDNRIVTVEEEDDDAVSPNKRERYDDSDDTEAGEEIANALITTRTLNTSDNNHDRIKRGYPNIYRVKEGYIVEEPAENDGK